MSKYFYSSKRSAGEDEIYPGSLARNKKVQSLNPTFAGRMQDVESPSPTSKVGSKARSEKTSRIPQICRKPTRRQKFMIYFILACFATLTSFLISRFFQALRIQESVPSIEVFSLTNLCTDTLSFGLVGTLQNPALIGASIESSSNVIKTQHGCVGTLVTPEIPVPAGESDFVLNGQFEVTTDCVDNLAKSIQSYIDGINLDISVDLSVNVGFSADVFLFPISLPVNIPLKSFIQSAFNTTKLTREEQRAEAELCAKFENCSSVLDTLQLISADNTTVTGRVGLNLTSSGNDEEDDDKTAEDEVSYFSEDFRFNFDVPGIDFEANVFEAPAVVGSSNAFIFGGDELLYALANLTWANVPAINEFLNKSLNYEDVVFSVTASQYDTSKGSSDYCFFNDLIEGLTLRSNLTSFDVETNSTSFISVDGVALDAFDENGVFNLATSLDVLGVQEFYNFEGLIPTICVDITTNISSVTAREKVGTLCTKTEVSISQDVNSSLVGPVLVDVDLDSTNLTIDIIDFILEEDGLLYDAFLFITPIGDRLIDALLKTLVVEFPLDFSEPENPSNRRMLSSGLDLGNKINRILQEEKSRLSVSVSSDSSSVSVEVGFRDFSADDIDGLKLGLGNLSLTLSVEDASTAKTATLSLEVDDFDTFYGIAPQNVTLKVVLSDDDNGNLLIDFLQGFISEYKSFDLMIGAEYDFNNQVSLVSVTEGIRRTNWTKFRAEDVDVSPIGSGTSGRVTSDVFLVEHAEFEGVDDKNIAISTALSVNLGFEVLISIAPIALGIADCSNKEILAVLSTGQIIVKGSDEDSEEAEEVNLQIEPGQLSSIVGALEKYNDGLPLSICLVEAQTPNLNFLSRVLISLEFSFDLEQGDSDSQSGSLNGDNSLEIVVESSERSACVNITVEVDRSPIEEQDSVSVGWGETFFAIADSSSNDFISFSITQGFIGGDCDSYWATQDSCNSNIVAEICLIADDSLDALAGAQVVRQSIKDFVIDQIALTYTLSGNTESRRGITSPNSFSSDVEVPANTLNIITGGDDDSDSSSSLVKSVELKSIIQKDFMLDIEVDLGNISLSLPTIDLLFSATDSDAQTEVSLSADLPSVNISIDSYEALLNVTFGQFDTVGVEGLESSSSFLSRCIPRFEISSNSTTEEAEPSANMNLDISGDDNEVVFSFLFVALNESLPFSFKMGAVDLTITNQISDIISISTSETAFGPQGSTFQMIMTGSGVDLPLTARDLFDGVDVSVGLQGVFTSTGMPISAEFVIKKEILDPVAVGTDDNKDDINNEFIPKELILLGGNDVGQDIKLPCLVDGICRDLLKDESTQVFTGITVGLGVQLPVLPEGLLRFQINFLTDFFLDIAANGFELGFAKLASGFTLKSDETGPGFVSNAVLTATLFSGQEENARICIQTLLEGYDTVFSFSGRSNENYASRLISAITQDIEILSESEQGDSEEVGQLDLNYQLVNTFRQQLEALLDLKLNYTEDNFDVSAGDIEVKVLYGHGPSGDSGIQVARAKLPEKFVLEGKPEEQTIPVTAFLEWADNTDYTAMNQLLSDGIFSKTLPLELLVDFEPIASTAAKYTAACISGCSFSLQTYLTIPEQVSSISFIESFQVDIGASSLWSDLLARDLTVPSVLAIENTFGIDLLPSFYSVEVFAYDTDGINADDFNDCTADLNPGGLFTSYLRPPLNEPQNVQQSTANQALQGGSRSAPMCRPPESVGGPVLCGQSGFILDKSIGKVGLNINPELTTQGIRIVDDFLVKNALCADIRSGQLVGGLQADIQGCVDNSFPARTADALECTFIIDLTFELTNFGLGDDSCKGIQEDASNQIKISDGNFGFQVSSILNWGPGLTSNPYTFTDLSYGCGSCNWNQRERFFQNTKVSIADSFRITYTEKITDKGGRDRDGYSIIFLDSASKPADIQENNENTYNGDCEFGWRCLTNTKSLGLVFKIKECNTFSVERDGTYLEDSDDPLFRRSQAVVAGMTYNNGADNFGRSRNYEIVYDAYSKRIRISVSEVNDVPRSAEFDVDFLNHFNGASFVYLGIGATNAGTTVLGVGTGGGNTFEIKDFRFSTARTGSKTTTLVDGAIELPVATNLGRIHIQARDPAGRPRGTGGEKFDVTILKTDGSNTEANSAPISSVDAAMTTSCTDCPSPTSPACDHVSNGKQRVCDNGDGTYTVYYIINERGRYLFKARCVSPDDRCQDRNVDSVITDRVFVRLPTV